MISLNIPDFNLELNGSHVLLVLAAAAVLILGLILLARVYIRTASHRDLSQKYAGHSWRSPLHARTKYPDVDSAQFRPFALYAGVIFSLLIVTSLLNWTSIPEAAEVVQYGEIVETEFEITPPQTTAPPPPPPPPQLPSVIEVPSEELEEVQSIEFMDQSIEAESVVEAPPPPNPTEVKKIVAPPPPPPPPKDDAEEIFKVVEEMPRFPGCEDIAGTKEEKRVCADRALMEFIHTHLQYPATARENNIQGNVVVQFVVNKDGTIQDIDVIRDIGGGCGEEVVRVVNLMNEKRIKWTPGKQRGVPVRVIFMLPVRFTLIVN